MTNSRGVARQRLSRRYGVCILIGREGLYVEHRPGETDTGQETYSEIRPATNRARRRSLPLKRSRYLFEFFNDEQRTINHEVIDRKRTNNENVLRFYAPPPVEK